MNHTTLEHEDIEDKCECDQKEAIPFLDIMCSIKGGKIDIDLHIKDTDRNQYIMPTSCHPAHTKKSIRYSLSLRIVRICIDPKNRDIRLMELKNKLIQRNYNEQVVDRAIKRAKAVPRRIALRKREQNINSKGLVLVQTYDPRLPSFPMMVKNNSYLAEVFPGVPLTGYRRQPNIRNKLIRAKVPTGTRIQRETQGRFKCGKGCPSCPYIRVSKSVRINKKDWKINK